ncbi:MAG: NAD-dependent epimerase/dehydratase family protein [Candidatus Altiarchaeia archaeon]
MARIKNRKVLISGGAGFVGSHIADRLVKQGNEVIVYDNLSSGNKMFLTDSIDDITFIKGDLLDKKKLAGALKGVDYVFHMAANADIKDNLLAPEKCLEQNTIATGNILEAMRANEVKGIAFASTGSVYGESLIHPTPEDAPFPTQTSMYGASKLACEGLLQAYSVGYGFNVHIFRFVSLMGERYTHGCVFDFYKKLSKNPKELPILGNGKQRKSYLYIKDCIEAMFKAIGSTKQDLNIYNLGHDDYIGVIAIADIVCEELGLTDVKYKYSGGERGWVGDSPFIHLDITKMKSLGWKPTKTIPECVKTTVSWLKENEWVFEARK